ncbi:fibropellin-1-like isoform X12 [Anneissia japonica]|uniref:fibropellin-1-like isoform X12 n=1 Tax=Anneissia japonica TaxID=1529436 RepID=UPI0014256A36|nr:fibropellin-1-like isoform X12 [Anneissia japonica]
MIQRQNHKCTTHYNSLFVTVVAVKIDWKEPIIMISSHGTSFLGSLFLIFQIVSVSSWPTGAPADACTDRTPQHGTVAQSSPSPFTLSFSTSDPYVKVTIDSASYSSIKGFLLQARQGNANGQIVGTWLSQTNSKLLECTAAYDSTTHTNSEDKVLPLELIWNPPESSQSNIVFVSTIVVNRNTFWVNGAVDACNPNPCGPGTCQSLYGTAVCTCPAGYSGTLCDISSATDTCLPNPCMNSGTCFTSENLDSYICLCESGYSGDNCENAPCSSSPCLNGGTCETVSNGYTCMCVSGYQGSRCDTATTPCMPNPCMNSGMCLVSSTNMDSYFCLCQSGYSGDHCENGLDVCSSDPCLNSGTCFVSSTFDSYVCLCTSGFSGVNCEIDACNPNPCQNSGNCIRRPTTFSPLYICQCNSNFTGTNCQTPASTPCDSSPCLNGGTCENDFNGYTCTCASGYEGNDCDTPINECASTPCQNNGSCIDMVDGFTCDCQVGYSGTNCQNDIDDCATAPCQNNGTCNDQVNGFTCTCPEGFAVNICEVQSGTPCASSPCIDNRGTCTNEDNGFSCNCITGYTGLMCESVDFCVDSPCKNSGTCLSLPTGSACSCINGYSGKTCSSAESENRTYAHNVNSLQSLHTLINVCNGLLYNQSVTVR